MKTKLIAFFVIILASFTVCNAKEGVGPLVIDVEKIANESIAGKDMQLKIQKKQTKIESQIEEKKKELTQKAQKIQEKKSTMSQTEFEQKAANLQNEIVTLDAKFQEDIEELQKKQQKASQIIVDKIKTIAADIAKKRGADSVVASNSLFYSSPKSDITADVIKELDKELQSVELD